MKKYARYNEITRNVVFGIILINTYNRYKEIPKLLLIYSAIFIFLIANDYFRLKYFCNNRIKASISLLISIVVGSFFTYWAKGYGNVYMFILIYETIMFYEGTLGKLLLIFHILAIFTFFCFDIVSFTKLKSIGFWMENGIDLLMLSLFMISYILVLFYMKGQIRERVKVQKLNKKLNESYEKLEKYSAKIEELTISKERNRVAQEIHDSLGHSLTALIMHLDFLEKIIENDTDRSKDLLVKAQSIARNSMDDVRKAVYALKNNDKSNSFIDTLEELKSNLTINENLDITYDIQIDLKNISLDLKNIIYKSIKEGLTNGIKHGKATKFDISICEKNKDIYIEIQDNGIGCKEIKKGNGLIGIENRIKALNGNVKYYTHENEGFTIEAKISTGRSE